MSIFALRVYLVFLRLKGWQQKVKGGPWKPISRLSTLAALNFSVTIKFFSSLALENFGTCLSWKLSFTAFLLFVNTFKQMLMVSIILLVAERRRAQTSRLQKDLPQCTAGYKTWIMHHASCFPGVTLVEIGVFIFVCICILISSCFSDSGRYPLKIWFFSLMAWQWNPASHLFSYLFSVLADRPTPSLQRVGRIAW